MRDCNKPQFCRGEHRSSARRLPESNSHLNHACRFYRCPTGDNGTCRYCTRVLFHIFANFHRRTANGRPYASVFFAALSFRQWQFPKTSAGYNRADAISTNDILNPNWPSVKTEHRSSARRLPESYSHLNHACRFYRCPAGEVGKHFY